MIIVHISILLHSLVVIVVIVVIVFFLSWCERYIHYALTRFLEETA